MTHISEVVYGLLSRPGACKPEKDLGARRSSTLNACPDSVFSQVRVTLQHKGSIACATLKVRECVP